VKLALVLKKNGNGRFEVGNENGKRSKLLVQLTLLTLKPKKVYALSKSGTENSLLLYLVILL
jgi:hypothetical protein